MTISSTAWEKYIALLRKVNDKAAELIRTYLEANQIPQTQKEMNALIEYAYAVSTKYGEAAAAAAAGMYDGIATASGMTLAPAVPAPTPEISEVAKAVVGTSKTGNEEIISGAIGRLVKQTGVDTTMQNAIRDGAEWAWIPMGDTCAFCITLASRGWQRASKKALKGGHAEHIHANCDCTYAVRFNSKTDVAGYDPDKYLEQYNNAEGTKPQDKINSMRREQYAKDADKINSRKRELYQRELLKTKYADERLKDGNVGATLGEKSAKVSEILNDYSKRPSKWSGKTDIMHIDDLPGIYGRKEWSCDITLREDAEIKAIIHEHLHARSVSYTNQETFIKWLNLEEGSVELYSQAICKANNMSFSPAYTEQVKNLRIIHSMTKLFPDEFSFARNLFDIPLTERYNWLKEKVQTVIKTNVYSKKKELELLKALLYFTGSD